MEEETVNLEGILRNQVAEFPHRRLFVGYSGGLDSTVLLHVAAASGLEPTAIHINHGLHANSDAWQRRCVAVCRCLGVEIESRAVQAAGGEAGFREARYAAFAALVGEGDLLLLGHHRKDQAETVLMRLAQGREPLAMPRTRRLPSGGQTLKPWLAVPRDALARHARRRALDWIEDPSNAAMHFDRNFLRHQVLPVLTERWPEVEGLLAAFGESQFVRDELLAYLLSPHGAISGQDSATGQGNEAGDSGTHPSDGVGARFGGQWAKSEVYDEGMCAHIALSAFPSKFRLTVLRHWLRGLGEFAATNRALAEFVRQLDSPADRTPSLRLQHGILRRHRAWVVYVASSP